MESIADTPKHTEPQPTKEGKASRFFKASFFTLIVYILLTSDIFMDTVMRYVPGSMDSKGLTMYGTVVHGVIFSILWCLVVFNLVVPQ